MNKTVQITLRARVLREYKETVSMPMSATYAELQAYASNRLGQVPREQFNDTSDPWLLEVADIKVLTTPAELSTVAAAPDERGMLSEYLAGSKRQIGTTTEWRYGSTQVFTVKTLDRSTTESTDNVWLFEVRNINGLLLASRLVRGRAGLNLLYENMVGYQPDTDKYEHVIGELRDQVLEMFYRITTNDTD